MRPSNREAVQDSTQELADALSKYQRNTNVNVVRAAQILDTLRQPSLAMDMAYQDTVGLCRHVQAMPGYRLRFPPAGHQHDC